MDENKEFLDNEEELEDGLVVLVDEDGHEHTLQVLERVELNGNDYAILVPWDEDIEDDDEWEAIVEFWNNYVDEQED